MNMRTGFRRVGGASCHVKMCEALPKHMQGMTREIYKFQTARDQRNKGYATSLMHSVCREADQFGITLVLFAKAYEVTDKRDDSEDDDRLTQEDLEDWYSRTFGFQVIQKEPCLMARAPGATPKVGLTLKPLAAAAFESARK